MYMRTTPFRGLYSHWAFGIASLYIGAEPVDFQQFAGYFNGQEIPLQGTLLPDLLCRSRNLPYLGGF